MSSTKSLLWAPQPGPQTALIRCPYPEILYGGARGGGKTDGVLGKYLIKSRLLGDKFNAVVFRREMPSSDDMIERAVQLFEPAGARTIGSKHTFKMPGGGRLRFRPLDSVAHADKYQGQNLSDATIEEAGLYPDSKPIDRLWGALRGGGGAQMILTANPGGAGQHWLKNRYIDPAPNGMTRLVRKLPNGNEHKYIFIPSKVQNNAILLREDPEYINRLYLVGDEKLVDAWLKGDWNAVEGAFFDCWSSDLVIKPFPIPDHWTRLVSFDWGSAKPFSTGWWAVASEDYIHNGIVIPKGAMVRYREWYGSKEPNVGLKMTAEDVGDGIHSRTSEKVHDWIADPAIFAEDGGPSIAERMGLPFRRADNRRLGRDGHMGGWDMMRQRMKGKMIYTFDTCVDSIRTIPVLQHDPNRAEDLDTDSEDHCFAAGTPVLTESGEVPIEQYVHGKHGGVWSAGKWRYAWGKLTQSEAATVRLAFSNGVVIDCTPDHRFMDCSGEWRYATDLVNKEVAWDQASLTKRPKSLTASVIGSAADTFKEKAIAYIERFGATTMAKSRRVGMSIIKMETRPITRQRILSALAHLSTVLIGTDQRAESEADIVSRKLRRPLQSGMGLRLDESGTLSITSKTSARLWRSVSLRRAMSAAANTWWSWLESSKASFVRVRVKPVHCVSVERLRKQPVYCLNVPETQSFTVHGLVVHNCADEWRYACMSRPWEMPLPQDPKKGIDTREPTLDELFAMQTPEKPGRI